MPQTTQWGLPYPSLSDAPNVPLDIQRLALAGDSALDQHAAIYPGTSEADINLTTGAGTIVNWTFSIPSSWQSADVMFHWAARQWSDAGVHVRTNYVLFFNGGQVGPRVQESGYVPAGGGCARMVQASRVFANIGAGTHRITITGQIDVGASGTAQIGAQFWFATLHRTR